MSDDENTIIQQATATVNISMDMDNIMKEKQRIVDHLCDLDVSKRLLLKEILDAAYVRGFFAGVQNQIKNRGADS